MSSEGSTKNRIRQIDLTKNYPESQDGADFCRFCQDVNGNAWHERANGGEPDEFDLGYVITTYREALDRITFLEHQGEGLFTPVRLLLERGLAVAVQQLRGAK